MERREASALIARRATPKGVKHRAPSGAPSPSFRESGKRGELPIPRMRNASRERPRLRAAEQQQPGSRQENRNAERTARQHSIDQLQGAAYTAR